MVLRFAVTLGIGFLAALSATAQTVVRFETSVGEFDMVLNPTNNPQLQGHVDNMLRYIESNSYTGSWINRADVLPSGDPFVLQMGGFYSHTKRPPLTIESTRSVATFPPITGAPGIPGLSNTSGTVSLALPGGAGGTNRNGGTSSFFVNVGNNTNLDADFTVFGAISDMTVINEIMDLMRVDRTTDPMFGAGPGNLAFTDVPLQDNGFQVFIKRVFVITDTMAIAQATAAVAPTMASSAAAFNAGGTPLPLAALPVPEPATAAMLFVATLSLLARRPLRPK
jgi:cyclophilin family peptidyl-prolyl cis-trans isomerase